MNRLLLILLILIVSCMPDPQMDNDAKSYYIKAYLFANKPVDKIHIKQITRYGFYAPDTTSDYDMADTYIGDALVYLIHDGDTIYLEVDEYWNRDYSSDHIVEEGGHYRIEAFIYDSIQNKTIELHAETTVPYTDSTIHLDTTEMFLNQDELRDSFWQIFESPEKYPHMTLNMAPSNNYHMLDFSGAGSAIFDLWVPTWKDRIPMQASSMVISPVHFQSVRFYEQYRLIVYHLNEEYADLFVYNGPKSEAWLYGDTKLVPEGLSNVSNGGGIFTGVASDTLKFYLFEQ